jgi:hypothetical protein
MEADKAMQFIYIQDQIKNRRLASGETVFPCLYLTGICITSLIFVEAIIHIVEFPAVISSLLGHLQRDEFYRFAEKLMSDAFLPFAKTSFYMISARKCRLPYQEPQCVTPSSRRINLSSKSEMRRVVGRTAANPIEQHLAALLGQPRIVSEDLKLLVQQVCDATNFGYEGIHPLHRATKREVLERTEENWANICQKSTSIAVNQRTVAGRSHA